MSTLAPQPGKEIPPSPVYNAPTPAESKAATGRVSSEGSINRDDEDDSCNFCNFSWLEKCSNVVTTFIEKVFYKLVVIFYNFNYVLIIYFNYVGTL